MTSNRATVDARLESALVQALGTTWQSAPSDTERRSIFVTDTTSGSWAMAMPDPRTGVIALVASGAGGAPRETIIFTPDLHGTDLYDWLETADLTAAAASMAQSLRTALSTR
ncbi:hypothetical protein AB0454_37245 [Streptomyces sp. NPDC093509]|uniref:hypothetical protein n=1 Tax=Streptomyces sp. NPDC093509 TaxID=3154982 RepID=UPI00344FDFCD